MKKKKNEQEGKEINVLAQEITRSEIPEHHIWLGVYLLAVKDAMKKTISKHKSLNTEWANPAEAKEWLEEYGDLVLQMNMLDTQAFDMLDLMKRYGKNKD